MAFGPEYRCDPARLTFGRATTRELAQAPSITDTDRQWLSPGFLNALDDPQRLRGYLAGKETLSWVIRKEGRLAGLAIIHTNCDEIPYGRALVYPKFQNKGIGEKAHLLRLRHWFTVLGKEALMSYFYKGNERSQNLVERLGYYHVRDGFDQSSGRHDKAYRAVNPEAWSIFHSYNPNVNATVHVRNQLSTTLDAARALITPS